MSGGMHRLWKGSFRRPRQTAGGRDDPRYGRRHGRHRVPEVGARRSRHSRRHQSRHARSRLRSVPTTAAWKGVELEGRECREAQLRRGNAFDAYTIVFGIRNVTDIPAALREAHRVLKRGCTFLLHGIFVQRLAGFSRLFMMPGSSRMIPRIGKAVTDDEESYRYLVESIRRFPRSNAFKAMVADAGFARSSAEPMLGGLVTIHSGWKI